MSGGRMALLAVACLSGLLSACGVRPQAEPVPLTTPRPGPPQPLATTGPLVPSERATPVVPGSG